MSRSVRVVAWALTIAAAAVCAEAHTVPLATDIVVTSSHRRASPGDRVRLTFAGAADVRAVLLTPGAGATPLALERRAGGAEAMVVLPPDAAEGLYLVHAWTGPADAPTAVGKRAFLVGRMVLDFFLPRYVDAKAPVADLNAYLEEFQELGGNTLVAHALITPEKAYFPSRIARTDIRKGATEDLVERVLAEADARGMAVFLSVSWDMTRSGPYSGRMREIVALMDELFSLYRHHPSLVGFYSYQEGSGTYYVPYVREFTSHAKTLDEGLLTAVAPFLDDPLLAGYLATVDTLDVVIYQGMVMASYRTDNRKRFPIRRVRDFAALGIGSKWLQDKFALVHVELFAYLEKRQQPDVIAAAYEDIYRQIASVATASASDGIALFAYHPHIHAARAEPLVGRSRKAVRDGLDVFRRITRESSAEPSPLAAYVPYSDWIVERWTRNFVDQFDAFRRAGIAMDILPYSPPIEESHYPYFPFHMNKDVLERLLRTRRVLVLPDVSGFQQTDSDLIDAFVKNGGVVVAFGPQIPMGRTYERDDLFGGHETGAATRRSLRAVGDFGRRLQRPRSSTFAVPITTPAWRAGTARVLVTFDDGSPAVMANRYGKGLAIAVVPSASQLAGGASDLIRDVFDFALAFAGHPPLPDIAGLSEASDIAVGWTDDGFAVAVVNHEAAPRDVTFKAPGAGAWIDLSDGSALTANANGTVVVTVPAHGVRLARFREGERQR